LKGKIAFLLIFAILANYFIPVSWRCKFSNKLATYSHQLGDIHTCIPSPIDDAKRLLKKEIRELRLSGSNVRIEPTTDAAFVSSVVLDFGKIRGSIFRFGSVHASCAYHTEKSMG